MQDIRIGDNGRYILRKQIKIRRRFVWRNVMENAKLCGYRLKRAKIKEP